MSKSLKQDIRERIYKLLRVQKEEERSNKSLLITSKLFETNEFKKAHTILFYASFNGEVPTFEMIKRAQTLEKRIALPKTDKDNKKITPFLVKHLDQDLQEGTFGIKEPKDTQSLTVEELDLVIVPGVAFDKYNNRLGRGGGYYDRFLDTLPPETPTIGLAFDFQIVDSIPNEEYDKKVSFVISN